MPLSDGSCVTETSAAHGRALEALHERLVTHEERVEYFQGNLPVERGIDGALDGGEAALPELLDYVVLG